MSETMLQLPQGPVRVREEGEGPPIVFVHGLLVDGRLWDDVVARLAPAARCIVPDLPLGSHRAALKPDARLETIEGSRPFAPLDQPERLAALVAEFVGISTSPPTPASTSSTAP